jgi:2-hydroxymuconate-semialdehyde hydrolase
MSPEPTDPGDSYESRFLNVQGTRTHYLEAGTKNEEVLVLLHSGEYGASAELSWQFNIGTLAKRYHVLAPDMLGFGQTDKLFDFEDAFDRRIRHIGAFLETLDVSEAHFIGNSIGAGYLASLASEEPPHEWPIRKMVLVSGGGGAPEQMDRFRDTFDGSEEVMRELLDLLVYAPKELGEDFLKRKTAESRIPGHWQSLNAIRSTPPFEQDREFRRQRSPEDIDVPALVVGGANDKMKPKGTLKTWANSIPDARVEFFEECCHCAQLEHPDKFNELTLEYLAE